MKRLEEESPPSPSLASSLLPTGSDDDDEEGSLHSSQHYYTVCPPPPPQALEPPKPRRVPSKVLAKWAVAAFLCILTVPAILLRPPAVGAPPTARKSALMVAFSSSGGNTSLLASLAKHAALNSSSDWLIVWSGMGHRRVLQNDTLAFDIHSKKWATLSSDKHDRLISPRPLPRWKAAGAPSADPAGMLVLFGSGKAGKGKGDVFYLDVWLLNLALLRWEKAKLVEPGPGAVQERSDAPALAPRRGHTALTLASEGHSGQNSRLIVYGGQNGERVQLGDAWVASITWPTVSWRQLTFNSSTPGETRPEARHGHAAVFCNSGAAAASPVMLIFGGRDGSRFFADVWALDVDAGVWEELKVDAESQLPPARAHHAVAYRRGRLVVWGGVAGPTFRSAAPLNDLWVFTLATRQWSRVEEYGLRPLPRFLFSSTQHQPAGASSPSLYVFGGETLQRCKLNDAWELDLDSLRWRLLAPNFFAAKRRCNELFDEVRDRWWWQRLMRTSSNKDDRGAAIIRCSHH